MSEKLCLQWHDFQENVKVSFGNLREDKHFTDVTLACEDGQQLEAHKVILAASSPFFQKLLEQNKHPHPLVYMRGLKSGDLLAIVDFLYFGKAKVFQENLDSFLAIAEELQLKGLIGKTEEKVENYENPESQMTNDPITKPTMSNSAKTESTFHERQSRNGPDTKNTVALSSHFSGDLEDHEQRVQSMMEKSQNNYANGLHKADICKVCGKEGKGNAIKDHIESNHLEGFIVPCNLCEKTFSYRNGLKKHKLKYHREVC